MILHMKYNNVSIAYYHVFPIVFMLFFGIYFTFYVYYKPYNISLFLF